MERLVVLRRWATALLVVLPLAAVGLPALADESADFARTRAAWSANLEELEAASTGLEALDLATAAATEEYQTVTGRLERARDRLGTLRVELGTAIDHQSAAERANDVAIRRLGQATMVLVTIEDSLAGYAADLDVEVVAAYKYAGDSARFRGIVDALRSSGSITEFTQSYEQLRNGTVRQKGLVDSVTALASRLADQRVIVATLQEQTESAHQAARDERRHVAGLTQRQLVLVEGIREDRVRQRELVEQLEAEQAEYTKRVASLQAQSDALTEQLRGYRYVGGAPGSRDLLWPTDGRVTSGFGYRVHPIFKSRRLHAGVDIPAPTGQPVYAAGAGTVVRAGHFGGYGNAVVVEHGDGLSTVSAHLSRVDVRAGTPVAAGDTIGAVGSTGYSTGPHLHFEIRLGGGPVDPLEWY